MRKNIPRNKCGFTLIELLVVLAILALLLSLAAPRYFNSVERSKETVLKHNLAQIREAIDKHFADTGKYPDILDDLVTKHYLRAAPVDPVMGNSAGWIIIPPADRTKGAIYDVKSGAQGNAQDGTAYGDW